VTSGAAIVMHDPGGELCFFFLKVSSVMHSDNNQLEPFFQLSPVCRRERYEIQFMLTKVVYFVTNDIRRLLDYGAYATLKPLPTT
jgi:hypothetical protein